MSAGADKSAHLRYANLPTLILPAQRVGSVTPHGGGCIGRGRRPNPERRSSIYRARSFADRNAAACRRYRT